MTRKEKIELLEDYIAWIDRQELINEGLADLFGRDYFEGQIVQHSFVLRSKYEKMISEKIGDTEDYLSWWLYEMDRDGCAGKEGNMKKIDSAEKLIDFLEIL